VGLPVFHSHTASATLIGRTRSAHRPVVACCAVETIVTRLLRFADSQPDAVAFIEGGQRLTYRGLERRVRATAAWLHRGGVRAADIVAVSFDGPLAKSLRSLQFFYALAYLGAVILPLPADVPRPRRLELVARLRARWLISSVAGSSEECWLIDPEACDWRSCERDGAAAPRGDDPRQPFLFHFSGGTTGTPKVVLFNHGQCLASHLNRCVEVGVTPMGRLVPSRPWPSTPGMRYLLTIHSVGGALINALLPETRQELERLIRETGATVVVATPWQLRRLLSSAAPAVRRAAEPKLLYLAGAFTAPHEIQAARDVIARNVGIAYGCTEVGLVSFLRADSPIGPPGDVGRLAAGLEARAVDDDHRPLPPGTAGSLGFRAPWIADGYVGNEEATAQHFHEGWFYPGDVGAISLDGRVSLQGRTDEVINFGGVKLLPDAIEAILVEHPDVEDAAVVGIPHPMAGTVPVALVVTQRPLDRHALMTFCAARIDRSRLPVEIVRVPQIIRSEAGKILRDRLVEEYKLVAS